MRLKLVPDVTRIDFFRWWQLSFGISFAAMLASIALFFMLGLNVGIDFLGGTTIRTESPNAVDVGAYRQALGGLDLGDVAVTEVFDPGFGADRHVAQIRIGIQGEGDDAVSAELVARIQGALNQVDPALKFTSVESVGPKVSGELVWQAVLAVAASLAAIMVYVWLRFEWQFAVGAAVAVVHDVTQTIGIFALLQIKFDLAIIAALLTIVGYSLNDTVVVFDRVRENLQRFKTMPLKDVLNLSINETLSRTVMTSLTTLIALFALLALGGDVIRGFVFAMIWGVFVGTYSTTFVASNILLWLGVKRDWSKKTDGKAGTKFADIDA